MTEATVENVASNEPVTVTENKTASNTDKPASSPAQDSEATAAPTKVSPAHDLRNIQALLAGGIFPGNYAPQIVAAYQLLDKMALQVEMEASKGAPK